MKLRQFCKLVNEPGNTARLVITIDHNNIILFGSKTLTGLVSSFQIIHDDIIITNVELRFVQTSLEFKRHNNGPDSWIIPEYTLMVLLQDVIDLINMLFLKVHITECEVSNETV